MSIILYRELFTESEILRWNVIGRTAFSCADPSAWNSLSLPAPLRDETLILDSSKFKALSHFRLLRTVTVSAWSMLEIFTKQCAIKMLIIIIIVITCKFYDFCTSSLLRYV